MEELEQAQEPERARAAFNMVALHLAGYTFDQVELFHPADMTPDRLHELLMRRITNLLGGWAEKQHMKIESFTSEDRSD